MDGLFSLLDPDASGSISFAELNKALRQPAAHPRLSLVEGRLHSLFNTAQRLTSRVPTPAPADAYGAAKEDPNDDQRATLATLLGWVRPRHLADKGENNKMMANVQRGGHHDLHFEEE